MLSQIRIQNFALIDQLELSFGKGLNVLTGETGAGKSIILDAIDIALGGKVNNRLIRQGAQQSSIEATFISNEAIDRWLEQQQIEPLDDSSITCCRELMVVDESVRSRCRVNGVLVNRQIMSQLRDRLVEITAQGQTVQLMDSARQRQLLDAYGGKAVLTQREAVAKAYGIFSEAEKALEKRRQSQQERRQRLDLLEFQLQELQAGELIDAEELGQLETERERLAHVVELQQLSYQAYQLLYQNDSEAAAAADLLGQAESQLQTMANYDESATNPLLEMVQSALTQVVEVGNQLNHYSSRLETDPARLSEIEERIVLLKRLCRKYGPSLSEVIAYQEKLQVELSDLTDSEQSLEKLEGDCQAAQEKLETVALALTNLRQTAATKLEKQLVQALKPLAMEKVVFVCQITPCPPTAVGNDRVVFYFSPNPGEKIQPLSSTASGGEMSRFLLALKSCFADSEKSSGTLIFDEIDVGVSGKVAQAIADKLHQLGQQDQVLCVTHQPLVAAMAEQHFRVEKQIIEECAGVMQDQTNGPLAFPEIRTVVRVQALDSKSSRQKELAQLTGGHSANEAIAFAESLLEKAEAQRLGKD